MPMERAPAGGAARRPTKGYRLELRIIPENISIPASEGCSFPRHRSSHVVAKTDVKGLVKIPRPLAGRRAKECLLGDPQGVVGGGGRSLYIGHRFADDRCLWIEHPQGVQLADLLKVIG